MIVMLLYWLAIVRSGAPVLELTGGGGGGGSPPVTVRTPNLLLWKIIGAGSQIRPLPIPV